MLPPIHSAARSLAPAAIDVAEEELLAGIVVVVAACLPDREESLLYLPLLLLRVWMLAEKKQN